MGETSPTREPSAGPERELIEAAVDEFHRSSRLPPADLQPSEEDRSPPVPAIESLPGYEIVREIHRGAQGIVYEAVQDGTRRTVAIKVLREGPFAGLRDRTRFDREVQILGQVSHPNIVAIHETGNAAGHFYYVMDHIRGQPLDVYLSNGERSIEATLQLFLKACDAINAAHLRGVIHRDLKPGHILIDAEGEPHILDFGLAKVEEQPVSGEPSTPVVTTTGQFIGTLPWASPEQAAGTPEKIDVRTDVYALGVILYQMLTGCFPYPVIGNARDVLNHILATEPIRPSASGRKLDGDVETIVLKSLSKEPPRRYQSAGELSRDIRHYLAGEPIEAKRDSAWYVLRTTLRRYRIQAAVAALFIVTIAVSAATLFVLYRQATTARADAEAEAETAATVNELLESLFSSADPHEVKGPDYTVRQLLDDYGNTLGDQLRDQPEIEALLRTAVGTAYSNLGQYDEAETHLRAALDIRQRTLDPMHPLIAESLVNLGWLLHLKRDFAEANQHLERALTIQQAVLGEEHEDLARALYSLGHVKNHCGDDAGAERLYLDALALRRKVLGPEHQETLRSMHDLGDLYSTYHGRYDETEALFLEALEIRRRTLGDEHPDTLISMSDLGILYCRLGRLDEAEPLLERTLQIRRRVLGVEHSATLDSMDGLALLYQAQGRHNEAEAVLVQTWETCSRVFGPEHARTVASMGGLARAYAAQGRIDEAESMWVEAVALYRRVYGEASPGTLVARNQLALVYRLQGRFDEARRIHRDVLDICERAYGTDHAATLWAMNKLALNHVVAGDAANGERITRAAVEGYRGAEKPDIVEWTFTLFARALALRNLERLHEAEQAYREMGALWRQAYPRGDALNPDLQFHYGECLLALGRFEEAEPLLLESHERFETSTIVPIERASILRMIVDLYDAWGKPEQAAAYRALLPEPELDEATSHE
jgi:serine/threonine protein kinase/Tfp pilus assembly protein PilF